MIPGLRRPGLGLASGGADGASETLFQKVLTLSQGRPVFTADRYVPDPVNTTKVAAFIDWNDASHRLAQATPAQQVALPLPHPDFAGARCATFSAHVYQSTRSPAQWAFFHDGQSVECWLVFTPTANTAETFLGTTDVFTTPGALVHYNGANVALYLASGVASINGASIGVIGVGVPSYLDIRMQISASPDWETRRKGTSIGAGDYIAPPAAGAAKFPLILGASTPALSLPAAMRWAALAFTPALAAADRATVREWIAHDYGIAP